MSAFGMIESFFFLSLGIVFILIVLLVYHFKQRITTVEQKSDTMFDIVQNLAKELTSIKSRLIVPNQVSAVLRSSDGPVEYEEEDESDDEDEDESDGEDSSDGDDESDGDESGEDDDDKVKVIELGELSSMDNIDEPSSESDTEPEPDMVELNENDSDKIKVLKVDSLESVQAPVIAVPDNNSEVFKKMPVGELRTLAISKGLCSDASKLNKVELVKMLSKK